MKDSQSTIVLSNDANLPVEVSEKIQALTNDLELLDDKLQEYKKVQESYDEFKSKLFDIMNEVGCVKYTTNAGTIFTVVSGSDDKVEVVLKLNEKKLQQEEPEIYKKYVEQTEKTTKGRTSYLRVTIPKKEGE